MLHERSAEAQGMLGDGEMLREREPTLERTRSAGAIQTQPQTSRALVILHKSEGQRDEYTGNYTVP